MAANVERLLYGWAPNAEQEEKLCAHLRMKGSVHEGLQAAQASLEARAKYFQDMMDSLLSRWVQAHTHMQPPASVVRRFPDYVVARLKLHGEYLLSDCHPGLAAAMLGSEQSNPAHLPNLGQC